MAETGKKVDVRYGAFACTIEGYDNPVEQLQLILGEMQKMIAETPQFSQIGTGAEAEEIKEALDPQSVDDGSPGIVVIRDSETTTEQQAAARVSPEPVADAEEVEDLAEASLAENPAEQALELGAATEAIETPQAIQTEVERDTEAVTEAVEDTEETGADGVAATAIAGAVAAVLGAAVIDSGDEEVDDVGDAGERTEPEATPHSNEDADPWFVPEVAAASPVMEEEASEPRHQDAVTEYTSETQVGEETVSEPTTDVSLTAFDVDSDLAEDTPSDETAEPAAFSIFADPADSSIDEATEEAAEPEAAPNIFAATEPEPEAAAAPDPVSEPVLESRQEREVAPNIFATPDPDPVASAIIFDDPEENLVEPSAAPKQVETAAQEVEPDSNDDQHSPASDWASKGVAATAVAVTATAAKSTVMNIFADPEPEPEAVPEPQPAEPSSPLDAVKKALSEATIPDAAQQKAEETVNIFAAPVSNPAAEASNEIGETADEAASVWDEATEQLSSATPDTVRQTLDDLGARVAEATDLSVESSIDQDPSAERQESAIASIFAAPPETVEAPAASAQTLLSESETQPMQGSRFESLLNKVHGAPVMGAPGEPQEQPESPPEPSPALASGIESAGDLAQRAGSESVSDLLAASAAWLTLAEGKSRFSRRDVMDVFEKIPGDHPRTLEARIKGYGRLVRSGMLVLVDDGVFAMAQTERDRFQTILDRA